LAEQALILPQAGSKNGEFETLDWIFTLGEPGRQTPGIALLLGRKRSGQKRYC